MSKTPPKSNAGTPQRPESGDTTLSSPTKSGQKEKRDDRMAFSDNDDEDEDAVKDREEQMLEDDLLSPATSDIGSDTERAYMEKDLEEHGLIRKPEGTPSKRSRSSRAEPGKGKEKEKGGKGKKDQSLPESDIVARWNRSFGDVCQVQVKA